MRHVCKTMAIALALCAAPLAQNVARAGVWDDIGFGLGYAGFDFQGQVNPLSLGADFRAVKVFDPTSFDPRRRATYDFGIGELAFDTGAFSVEVSSSTRFLPQLEVSFQTAATADGVAQPLGYTFTTDVGGQSVEVQGDILMDMDFSINGFGFYELTGVYSSRQTTTSDGRFDNTSRENDFDIGPIDISGNIFADVLAAVTDPLFEQFGAQNPFASFSSRAQLDEIFSTSAKTAQERAASGGELTDADISLLVGALTLDQVLGSATSGAGVSGPNGQTAIPSAAAVPEPSTIVFMLVSGAFLAASGRRQTRRAL